MKCERCGINNANVIIKKNVNGDKSIEHICSQCANSEEMLNFNFNFSFDRLFSNLFDKDIFRFTMPREKVLIGDSRKMKTSEQKINKNINIGEKKIEKHIDTINDLEFKLKKAIEDERYEDAAVLRDKIKKINK